MVVHAQVVDTRPLSPLLRSLGTRLCLIPTDCVDDMTSTSLTCKLNQTYKHTFLSSIFSSFGSRRQEKNHHVMESWNLSRNTQPVVHSGTCSISTSPDKSRDCACMCVKCVHEWMCVYWVCLKCVCVHVKCAHVWCVVCGVRCVVCEVCWE